MSKSSYYSLIPFLAFSLFLLSEAYAQQSRKTAVDVLPGIEDRIAQSDLIAVGVPKLLKKAAVKPNLEYRVDVRFKIETILKGNPKLNEVEYSTSYFPNGLRRSGALGSEDLQDFWFSQMYPYDQKEPPRLIVFLKQQKDQWILIYSMFESSSITPPPSFKEILEIETLDVSARFKAWINILSHSSREASLKYALRGILRSDKSWKEKSRFLGNAPVLKPENKDLLDEGYIYIDRLMDEDIVPQAEAGLLIELCIGWLENSKSIQAYNLHLVHLKEIADQIRKYPDEIKRLQKVLTKSQFEFKRSGSDELEALKKNQDGLLKAIGINPN